MDKEKGKGYQTIKQDLLAQIEEEEEISSLSSGDQFSQQPPTQVESISIFGILLNLLFSIFIIPILGGFFTVEPQQHALVVFMGSLTRVITTPGWYWFPVIGRRMAKIPTSTQTLDIKKNNSC